MKVDQIKGWNLPKCKSKAKLMKLVAKEVLHRWCEIVRNSWDGGIGKSTLAKVIFNQLSSDFGVCCAFLDDIQEKSKNDDLVELQEKLLREIVSPSAADIINDVDYGRIRIQETLGSKKMIRKYGTLLRWQAN
ncbi:hypothetical protein NL676_034322 [Syzygium grande]|nr:hypothetical protein NL676_034322 [Syzygium grande]